MGQSLLFHLRTACLANIVLIVILAGVASSQPRSDIRISSHADGLILTGKTFFAMRKVIYFPNWKELEKYLSEEKLSISQSSRVEKNELSEARLIVEDFYKIFRNQKDSSFLLASPDQKSAEIFFRHARSGRLSPGLFGHSIKAERE